MPRKKKNNVLLFLFGIIMLFTIIILAIKVMAKSGLKLLGFTPELKTKWNPHKVDLNASETTIEYKPNKTLRFHLIAKNDLGHLASGYWRLKEPHFPLNSRVAFEVKMTKALRDVNFERCAVACAIRSPQFEGVKYIELDFWRGTNTNKEEIIRGFEYPIAQIPIGQYIHFDHRFLPYIKKSYKITEGFIESVYIVMEVDKSISELELEFKNFTVYDVKEVKIQNDQKN